MLRLLSFWRGLRRPELSEACTQISTASGTLACNRKVRCEALAYSVVDPYHFDSTYQQDPDCDFYLMRIRIRVRLSP
jgi:hypothetical protein